MKSPIPAVADAKQLWRAFDAAIQNCLPPEPAPESEYIYVVIKGDTLGQILVNYGYRGSKLFGDNGLAQRVASENGITNRGLIYPKEVIRFKRAWFDEYK